MAVLLAYSHTGAENCKKSHSLNCGIFKLISSQCDSRSLYFCPHSTHTNNTGQAIGVLTKQAIDQLPSLPQVLLQILDAIHSDDADYQRIAEIIRQDTAIAARIIAVANSSYFGRPKQCETIERALLYLGTDTVKTIVITASIKQFYSHFSQSHSTFINQFWRRSLVSANFAQVLATLTSYPAPDEAYLCGLLSNVGQLILLGAEEQQYLGLVDAADSDQQLLQAEQELFSTNHAQLSGELVDSWNIPGFMADAVRYHHEPATLVQDAHHLVKIINLSSVLSAPENEDGNLDDSALAAADALFGLNEALTTELYGRINDDVDNVAKSLGIDIGDNVDAHQARDKSQRKLGERLADLGELAQMNASFWQARNQDSLFSSIKRSLFLTFGIQSSLLFRYDADGQKLVTQLDEQDVSESTEFSVALIAGRSLVTDALLDKKPLYSPADSDPVSVLDRQLLTLCGGGQLICWPLVTHNNGVQQALGVLVFAATTEQMASLQNRSNLATTLCREIANAIANNEQQFKLLGAQGSATDQWQEKIREAVHEASNPLSIIRNYLEMLRIKLGDEHSANEGLGLIKEEIDRVGNILLRLKDPNLDNGDESIDINQIIEATTQIFRDSLFATKQLDVKLNLDPKVAALQANPEHLKQILTNLLKNATEALDPGGKITISSEASVSFGGKNFAVVSIEDNGPGLADEIKHNLFSPVTSTKGEGHSGLGLSIVKKLIDDMNGSIVCRSNKESGTQFQILLPK